MSATLFPALDGPLTIIVMMVVLLAAGFVRGFSGFGFSAIVVTTMGLLTDPMIIIPMLMLFEIAASLVQFNSVIRVADKRQVARLFAGAVIAMPIGVSFLVSLGIDLVRTVIAVVVLGLSLVLLSGWSLKRPPGPIGQVGVGLFSGFINSAAIGGLPVGLFLAAQDTGPERFRANMIVYLMALDIVGVGILWWYGRMNFDIAVTSLFLFPVMFLGSQLGTARFRKSRPGSFRRMVIVLLMALAIAALAKSFL